MLYWACIMAEGMQNNTFSAAAQFIADIMATCGNNTHIFRGTTKKCGEVIKGKHDEISSGLYRKYAHSDDPDPFTDEYYPIHEEKEIIDMSTRFFPHSYTIIEKLTTLRHFGCNTTLIDFSHDLYIALFFACNGDDKLDGQIIMIKTNEPSMRPNSEIAYKERYEPDDLSPAIIEAAHTDISRARALFQRSVFVHAPKGYIEKEKYTTHAVARDLKKPILAFLDRFHQIKTPTVYHDTIGYIDYERSYQSASSMFYLGKAYEKEGNPKKAKECYNDSRRLKEKNASNTIYTQDTQKV